jgi:Trypsin-like peptidase domain
MHFPYVPHVTLAVGRVTSTGTVLLGTAFVVAQGKFATTMHVTGGNDDGLVLVLPRIQTFLDYQDTSDPKIVTRPVTIAAADPFRDICVLSIDIDMAPQYEISGADEVPPGSPVVIFGFPHADAGRLVLTQHDTHVGARVLIDSSGVKSKHIVLNTQARPGQSGSPVFSMPEQRVVAMVVGSYAPVEAEA